LVAFNVHVPTVTGVTTPVVEFTEHTVGVVVAKVTAPAVDPEPVPVSGVSTVAVAVSLMLVGVTVAVSAAWFALAITNVSSGEVAARYESVAARVALTRQFPELTGVTKPEVAFTEQIAGVEVAKLTAPVPVPPPAAPAAGKVAVVVVG
jgi:hypothetical protein